MRVKLKYLFIFSIVIVMVISTILLISPTKYPSTLSKSVSFASFTVLSHATSDVCIFGISQTNSFIDSKPNGSYLQGSCCTYMVYSTYNKQITGLKEYSNISEIPQDPYNVSVSLVKQMLQYWNATLTPQQNATLTAALAITKQMGGDPGYCCCQCWAWYFHEGLLKYLILHYNMSAENLGNVLYLEDCCGGTLGSPGFNA